MEFNASNLIALVALAVPLVQSFFSYFETKIKLSSERKNKANERKELRRENRINQMKETFEEYATVTQSEISSDWHPFDAKQRNLYLKVLLFADGEFRKKLKSFDAICYNLGQEAPKRKAFNKMID